MGFDLNIMLERCRCPDTGRPYYLTWVKQKRDFEKVYEVPNIQVPPKMCEYLVGRGPIFYAYTEPFNEKGISNVSVSEFLEAFPSWDDVRRHSCYDKDGHWIEEDHEGFQRLIEWCNDQEPPFRVCWSY